MHVATKSLSVLASCAAVAVSIAIAGEPLPQSAKDKYTVSVPGGLSFSEFKGYESWELVSLSQTEQAVAVILGNPVMIKAYAEGIPGNGKPFPDGAMMAKMHWTPAKNQFFPNTTVPGQQRDVDFMVKDSKRFADGGGWGYAFFKVDAASGAFRPANINDQPSQANDAKCGVACHSVAKARDYVFTNYASR
jgi:hypothetical protein